MTPVLRGSLPTAREGQSPAGERPAQGPPAARGKDARPHGVEAARAGQAACFRRQAADWEPHGSWQQPQTMRTTVITLLKIFREDFQ